MRNNTRKTYICVYVVVHTCKHQIDLPHINNDNLLVIAYNLLLLAKLYSYILLIIKEMRQIRDLTDRQKLR